MTQQVVVACFVVAREEAPTQSCRDESEGQSECHYEEEKVKQDRGPEVMLRSKREFLGVKTDNFRT